MKKRISIVDLWRFVAAIMIMVHHLYYLGEPFEGNDFRGKFAWICVEFFLILTGYFTYSHFNSHREDGKDIFKAGIEYTIKKFKVFLPYTTIAVTLDYILLAEYSLLREDTYTFFSHFFNYPYEVLFLGEMVQSKQLLGPIWFLSSMFIVFPIVTFLCQIKNKYLLLVISGMSSLIYFGQAEFDGREWPNDFLRVFFGIMLGIFVCILTDIIKENTAKRNTVLLSCIEFSCMIFAFVAIIFNLYDLKRVIILAFAIAVGIMMSGASITSKLDSAFISYLGLLSMPMFIWQKVVCDIINRVNLYVPLTMPIKLVMYFGGTLIVAAVSYAIVERIKASKKAKKAA